MQLYSGEHLAMRWLIRFVVRSYLLAPRVLLGHIISVSLFYSLMAKQSTGVGRLATRLVLQETVQLLLWLVVPSEGLAIALSLMFCLWLCRPASGGTFVAVYDKITLTAGR